METVIRSEVASGSWLEEGMNRGMGYIPTSGLAGSYGNSKFIYLF